MNLRIPIALLFTATAIAGGYYFTRPTTAAAPRDFTFYFTCDTRGRLVPCGCFTGQYGGLTRLKTVLASEASSDSIKVDVGDAIRGSEDYNLIEYQYILQAYADMGYDALNLGHREARLSAAQLKEINAQSPVRLISANLFEDSGAPLFEPYHIVRRDRYRIALVGGMDARGADNLGEGLAVEKLEIALHKLLPELRKKADIIVLLAFADEATLAALAGEFYELDLIFGGKVSQSSQELLKENQSLILYTANESRTLGMLKVRVNDRSRLAPLEHEIRLLHDRIPEDDSVAALADAYRNEVRHTRLLIDDPAHLQADMVPGVRSAAQFAGTENCLECHPTAGALWKKTSHAHAFSTLVSRNADADPNCIACHTVGFGSPSGYRREFAGKKLTEVGCESCHGPGSLHVEQHREHAPITFKFRPLGSGDCQKCHYGEFSRPFDWDEFWPLIQHGKEELKSEARKPNLSIRNLNQLNP
jgi:hypothetical protein